MSHKIVDYPFWIVFSFVFFINRWNETTRLKFYYVIARYILAVNEWFCNLITMQLNEVDLSYQKLMKY